MLTLRPPVFDHNVLALDTAGFFQALLKPGHQMLYGPGDPLFKNPITGIVGCCERPASGHTTTAPLKSDMKSRRLIGRPEAQDKLKLPH
jgi:hypothetical protein